MDLDMLKKTIIDGKLAIIPTDTVYGIIGDATNINTIHNVYNVKKRDYSKPLILMVSSIDMLTRCVDNISYLEQKLIDRYWPGKLTILFKKNNKVDDLISSGGDYVGIRLPDNEDIIELIKMVDRPLISTSANISSKETITKIDMLEEDIKDHIAYIYDGGEVTNSSSTIVKVENNKIIIIREGELALNIKEEFKGDIG